MVKIVRQLHRQHPVRSNIFWAFVLILITWALTLRALDTGSLGQWGLVFLLIGLTINRFGKAIQSLHVKLQK